MRVLALLLGVSSAALASVQPASAGLYAPAKGLYTAELPPELVQSGGAGLDLKLIGPDGMPLAFELAWKEPVQDGTLGLEPLRYEMVEKGVFAWEAAVEPGFRAEALSLSTGTSGFSGTVDVELDGRVVARARPLFERETRFKLGGTEAGTLRLTLRSQDERFKGLAHPIHGVRLEGTWKESKGRLSQPLAHDLVKGEGYYDLHLDLPGRGLFIEELRLRTGGAFLGSWQLMKQDVAESRERFTEVKSGQARRIPSEPDMLAIPLHEALGAERLVLRLHAREGFKGVEEARAVFRLPRLVFYADQPGRYLVRAGLGGSAELLQESPRRQAASRLSFSPPVAQSQGLDSLVARYGGRGAPFKRKGWRWRADVEAASSGYWKLKLPREAALMDKASALRLVREGEQVPFLLGGESGAEVELEPKLKFDAEANQSRWTLALPQASARWTHLSLKSRGRFARTLRLEKDAPAGSRGAVRSYTWNNEGGEAALDIPLGAAYEKEAELVLSMDHGDNQPIELEAAHIHYRAPELLFLFDGVGKLELYGGHPDAEWPRYDLELARPSLMLELPKEAAASGLKPLKPSLWGERLDFAFQERSLILYAVLFGVTVLLVLLILKLFPRQDSSLDQGRRREKREKATDGL